MRRRPPEPAVASAGVVPGVASDLSGERADAQVLGAATTVLRAGLVLLTGTAIVDTVLAIADRSPAGTVLEGVVIIALAGAATARPDVAGRLLRPTGRAALLVALFAVAGALHGGLQTHYAQVGSALIWIAAVVSSPRWVVVSILVAGAGYVLGLAAHGHSWHWMVHGDGRSIIATQQFDILLNGIVGAVAVVALRRLLVGVPAQLDAVRRGGPSLTPRLAAAARGETLALDRADATDVVGRLTDAERRVLEELSRGRAPKQAAVALGVALPTVRSQIASAKRRTGCRTVNQLVALYAEGTVDG